MSEVTKFDESIADAIVSGVQDEYGNEVFIDNQHEPGEVLREQIALALATARESARPPKGCVMDDEGRVRKVLGTLSITADGCVIGDGAILHYPSGPSNVIRLHPVRPEFAVSAMFTALIGYSTEEAALAAKEAKDNGR